jgi:hypothetical protein
MSYAFIPASASARVTLTVTVVVPPTLKMLPADATVTDVPDEAPAARAPTRSATPPRTPTAHTPSLVLRPSIHRVT